jgi:hypothetical protein
LDRDFSGQARVILEQRQVHRQRFPFRGLHQFRQQKRGDRGALHLLGEGGAHGRFDGPLDR